MASVHAFNLWLDEDWGFDRPDHRIIAAPIISLADPDAAVAEVEFVLARGAKMVLVRPAPVPGVVKPRRWAIRRTTRCGRAWPRPACRWAFTSATAATCIGPVRQPGGRCQTGFQRERPKYGRIST